jgi:DNA polymerase V
MLNHTPATRPSLEILTPEALSLFKGHPYFKNGVSAGFPSPAADYLQRNLSLDEHVTRHASSTYYIRVYGRSMIYANIFDGDILVVDRAITAFHDAIVVAIIDGEFTVKRMLKTESGITLKAENPAYPPIHIIEGMDFEVWGVVTHVLHKAI